MTRAGCAAIVLAGLAWAGCGGGDDRSATTPRTTTTAPVTTPRTTTAPPTAERSALVVGIGAQGAAMFDQPAFRDLGIRHARLVTAWDTTRVKFERELVDAWMAAARRARVEPFVTFAHSRVHPSQLPGVEEYTAAVAEFRKRYPDVRVYAPWNEINHDSQPTADHPERAADYYRALRDGCRGCTVVAADVLDQAGVTRYLERFKARLGGEEPRLWGLHNYSHTNRFRNRGTREVLRAVRGDVWLTETGGVVQFGRAFPYSLNRQARAIRYMFRLARSSPRIRRLYIYNWTGAPRDARFDAGLISPAGRPRPAYRAVARALRR
ncbi:MAG: hypothetical protein HZB46_10940 [Solirubrobacterales bacterium]|nr:hypothetical protein [Solirubrobacterales bacterium]